jgi:hypothetical protein
VLQPANDWLHALRLARTAKVTVAVTFLVSVVIYAI